MITFFKVIGYIFIYTDKSNNKKDFTFVLDVVMKNLSWQVGLMIELNCEVDFGGVMQAHFH